ncbi:MAG: type I restriction enzyme HsdR N-terminal domain-containing protein [Bacteroidales bacterium]
MTFTPRIKKKSNGRHEIFDAIRKKYVTLTPEELVRQEFIHFLITQKGYPPTLLLIEHSVKIQECIHRCDIAVCNKAGKFVLLIECKAPHIHLSNDTFEQIARYNLCMQVPYLAITNGVQSFCCSVNFSNKQISFLAAIPNYQDIA